MSIKCMTSERGRLFPAQQVSSLQISVLRSRRAEVPRVNAHIEAMLQRDLFRDSIRPDVFPRRHFSTTV